MQLRGKLDARRPRADDAEVQQLSPVCVRDGGLVRLLEAWCGSARVSAAAARDGWTLGESTAAGADAEEEEDQEANDDQASDGSADDPAHHRRVGLLPVERSEAWRQNMELQ